VGYDAAISGNSLPEGRDDLSAPSLRVKNKKKVGKELPLSLRNNAEGRSSHLLRGGSLKSCMDHCP